MQKVTTFLWFNDQAEEAAKLYCSIFPSSRLLDVSRAPEGTPGIGGKVMSVSFELAGQQYFALNGAGPDRKFSDTISLFVRCEDQAEIDRLWDALLANGGTPTQCGWLRDKFGVAWQIVPSKLSTYLKGPTGGKVMQAMLPMQKLDIATLERAYGS
ncbi:MAG TPA: VOC family protein [Polyangiales bacterium]|nr:VOC family protein [Polyangiales bacterium]